MIPAALAVVVAAFPIAERGRALAIFFGVSGGLTAIGPIAGGYLTQWTWRAIFWINIPVAIVALVLTVMAGISSESRRERIDWRGAALVLLDACVRLLPGVMGRASSGDDESFSHGLLEYPQYTKPRDFEGAAIPDVLMSGNHADIAAWRRAQAEALTRERRPELLRPRADDEDVQT